MSNQPKKPTPKTEIKLAVNASFDDMIRLAVNKEPKKKRELKPKQ